MFCQSEVRFYGTVYLCFVRLSRANDMIVDRVILTIYSLPFQWDHYLVILYSLKMPSRAKIWNSDWFFEGESVWKFEVWVSVAED